MGYLAPITREVIGRLAVTARLLRETDIATVVGLKDTELPALREVHLQVQLARGAVLSGRHTRPRLGDVFVEEKGDELLVGRNGLSDAALGAAAAAIVDVDESDLVGWGSVALLEGSGDGEAEAGDGGCDESAEEHFG